MIKEADESAKAGDDLFRSLQSGFFSPSRYQLVSLRSAPFGVTYLWIKMDVFYYWKDIEKDLEAGCKSACLDQAERS